MKYKAVFFDMDGTVLDTLEDLYSALQHTLLALGYEGCSIEQCRAWLGNGAVRLLKQALPPEADAGLVEKALAEFKEYYSRNCRVNTKCYDGILPLLERIKNQGMATAVISNKISEYVKQLSDEYFPGLMDVAVGDSPGVRLKPWPDLLLQTAEKLDLSAEDCLYVGDSEMDIQAAANAGMDCVSVSWGFRTSQQLEKAGASVIADECGQLEKLIFR